MTVECASCRPVRDSTKITSTTTRAAAGWPFFDSFDSGLFAPTPSRDCAYMIRAAPLATPREIANKLIVAIRLRMSEYHLPMYPVPRSENGRPAAYALAPAVVAP